MNALSTLKRYALVGAGSRAAMFLDPIARDYAAGCALVGLCDSSRTRMRYHQERLRRDYGSAAVPLYAAADFDRMIRETRPDTVIVCTVDAVHDEYIVRALRLGCDVITEKPLTTDEVKCAAILAAARETGRRVRVCFNYRWGPGATAVWEALRSGVIGEVKSASLEYLLNTSHGADYFRRWHSDKTQSGGLLVHKSTHHFDLVNWWLDAIPAEVFAWGRLAFYGGQNARARGDEALTRYPRYTGHDCDDDPFALKLEQGALKALYRDAEAETGYLRDQNVFRDGITIEDTMSVLVKYRTGVTLNYSLNAFSPVEGFRVTFNGDRGRIEYQEDHGAHLLGGPGDRARARQAVLAGDYRCRLTVIPHFQPARDLPIPNPEGPHGGADPVLQRQIFSPQPPPETRGRNAGAEQGAASILVGIAANRSLASGQPVRLDRLLELRPECRRLSELQ